MLGRHQLGQVVVDTGAGFRLADFAAGRERDPGGAVPGAFPALPDTAGLVDLQVNGFAGIDFNDAALTAEGLDHALAAMLASGVTTCLPTVITAAPDALEARR